MMKYFLTTLIITIMSFNLAHGLVKYEDRMLKKPREIKAAGFINYAPFGKVTRKEEKMKGTFATVFQPMMDEVSQENNFNVIYTTLEKDYPNLVQKVRSGDIDVLIGAYHQTEIYKGLDFVFPSILSNPVTVFMLPNRINEVSSVNDLKKLKGIRSSQEYYSDFVNEQLKPYNLEVVDDSYVMFEKLFTRQVDYILAGQYFGLIEASKLGLRNHISPAKQTLWKIPVFIGVSKISPNRNILMNRLTKYSENPENQKKIKENLIKVVNDFEKANDGIVPPTFGMEK